MSFFWRQVVAKSPITAERSEAYEKGWNAINQFVREDYSWNGREPNVFYVRRNGRYFDASGISGLDCALDSRAFAGHGHRRGRQSRPGAEEPSRAASEGVPQRVYGRQEVYRHPSDGHEIESRCDWRARPGGRRCAVFSRPVPAISRSIRKRSTSGSAMPPRCRTSGFFGRPGLRQDFQKLAAVTVTTLRKGPPSCEKRRFEAATSRRP